MSSVDYPTSPFHKATHASATATGFRKSVALYYQILSSQTKFCASNKLLLPICIMFYLGVVISSKFCNIKFKNQIKLES
jgi:hypothetical protein